MALDIDIGNLSDQQHAESVWGRVNFVLLLVFQIGFHLVLLKILLNILKWYMGKIRQPRWILTNKCPMKEVIYWFSIIESLCWNSTNEIKTVSCQNFLSILESDFWVFQVSSALFCWQYCLMSKDRWVNSSVPLNINKKSASWYWSFKMLSVLLFANLARFVKFHFPNRMLTMKYYLSNSFIFYGFYPSAPVFVLLANIV